MKFSDKSILKLLHQKTNRPMKFAELAKSLSVADSQRREFRHWIKDMVDRGALVKLRGGRYGLPDQMNLITGLLAGHPDGYGFLVSEEQDDDIYISRNKMGGAMHGDQILVRVESKQHKYERPEGRVIRVVKRNTKTIVGAYEPLGQNGWVIPSDPKFFHDIFVSSKDKKGAKPGHVVSVEILSYPTLHNPPTGKVKEVLGFADDPEVELRSIFHKYGTRQSFPPKAMDEAQRLNEKIPEAERKKREDLTDWMIFTIDGESAKDFDDAVSLEKLEKGYRLGVHIADVSHYVTQGGPLDKEAFERGTSVYFADGVIPMIPFKLSNEICSLKPKVERLTLSALIDYDQEGKAKGYEIFTSIIKSRQRFTYDQVADLLEAKDPPKKFQPFMATLKDMQTFSQILRKRRVREGSINFHIPEPEIILNDKGEVERIEVAKHNQAHELIEEFMLSANRVVAEHLSSKKIPSIHRIHESPDEEKLHMFNEYIKPFGFKLSSIRNVKSVSLQNLLKKFRDHPEERVVNTLLLRAMKKAVYSAYDPGHFALGFVHYTHFTSPIRRYPDLATHRTLKAYSGKTKISANEKKTLLSRAVKTADQSTTMELKAQSIEREVVSLRRAQFMKDKIGKSYSGIITSVKSFGFFVELVEVFVEGMVHVSSLKDDYYIYSEAEHQLKGQHRYRTFTIGDTVKVRVADVDISKRRIDLTLTSKR